MSRAAKPAKTKGQNPTEFDVGKVADRASTLFGSKAATAVAFCALEAWLEGSDGEYRELASVFRHLNH